MLVYMLDTNIVIYTIKNRPPAVRDKFIRNNGRMCISGVTLMELIYGAQKSSAPERNMRHIEEFSARLEVLKYDSGAALQTGQIRASLAIKGTPIGPYDTMLAGHARSRGLTLVTNNLKEFRHVEGLLTENWVDE